MRCDDCSFYEKFLFTASSLSVIVRGIVNRKSLPQEILLRQVKTGQKLFLHGFVFRLKYQGYAIGNFIQLWVHCILMLPVAVKTEIHFVLKGTVYWLCTYKNKKNVFKITSSLTFSLVDAIANETSAAPFASLEYGCVAMAPRGRGP